MVKLPEVAQVSTTLTPAPGRADTSQVARALIGLGQDIKGVAFEFGDALERERRKENMRRAKELDAQYAATVRSRLIEGDPGDAMAGANATPGLMSLSGSAFVDAAPSVAGDLEKERRAMIERIKDPNLRDTVAATTQTRLDSALDRIATHTIAQRQKALADASASRLAQFHDDAAANYRDPEAREAALAAAQNEAAEFTVLQGMGEDQADAFMQQTETQFHARIVDRMLADGDAAGAKAYFAERIDDIDGREHAKILRAIRAEANRQETENRDEVRDAVAVLNAGKIPPGLVSLQAKVKGSKLEKPLNEAVENRVVMDDFVHKSLPDQASELFTLQQKETMTRQEVTQLQAKQQSLTSTQAAIKRGDGLAVAARLEYIREPITINYSDPSTLSERKRQADVASARLGVRISPLTKGEITTLEDSLDKATATSATGILNSLREGFGQDYALTIAADLAKGKRPEFAVAILRAEDNPRVAVDIVMGGRLRREHGQNLQITSEQRQAAVAEVFGDMFAGGDAGPLGEFVKAADALYASRRIPTGDLSFDDDAYEQSLKDAAGGVVEYNGRKTIAPAPDLDGDDLEDIISQLTVEDLTAHSVHGGPPVAADGSEYGLDLFTGAPFFSLSSRDGAQLIPTGPGVYRLLIPGLGLVMDGATRQPYELNLRGMRPQTGPRRTIGG